MRFVFSLLLIIISTVFFAVITNAQETWELTKLEASSFPINIVEEKRTKAPNNDSLPDGLLATSATGDIRKAWYSAPTTRYAHGVLGDSVEGGMLKVITSRGATLRILLPPTQVFEDRTPRLVDLDGDGKIEVVTIKSSTITGAAISVYGLVGNALIEKASTNYIGRANRWLNIAGINAYAGVRGKEIAYVVTPHIGGTLKFVKYFRGKLLPIASSKGFSNHVIGSREMRLSASFDVNGDKRLDLALPSGDRTKLKIISFGSGGPKVIANIELPSPINKAIATPNTGGAKGFTVGLLNGEVYQVSK